MFVRMYVYVGELRMRNIQYFHVTYKHVQQKQYMTSIYDVDLLVHVLIYLYELICRDRGKKIIQKKCRNFRFKQIGTVLRNS